MSVGIKFQPILVDNHIICNGHHRYVASLISGTILEYAPSKQCSPAVAWELVLFEQEDWDTETKIAHLNEEDAKINNISVEELVNKLK